MNPVGATRPSWWLLTGPSVVLLLIWMIGPLAGALYFSFVRKNLMNPNLTGFVWFQNYINLLHDPVFWISIVNTLVLVGSVLVITVVVGILLALLMSEDFPGRTLARLLLISPFFVMPVVAALVWKNMLMHPVYGIMSWVQRSLGLPVTDWFQDFPMTAIIIIISWEWIPFAMLVFLTSLQSMPEEQREAARLDGAGPLQMFFRIVLPHLSQAIAAVLMIECIFFLSIYAEIFTTTSGGPGTATTNLVYVIYKRGFNEWNFGSASAGGIYAVILANFVAFFLIRLIARNMKNQETWK
ncbi:MAG: carbohydrate ABC transporter permease [Alphaproteobacteria bacterium]